MKFYPLIGSLLFRLEPENAHRLAIRAMKSGLVRLPALPRDRRLAVTAAGMNFPHPLGFAAGFDKNAEVANALLKLGFAFAEVGTVTPRPQRGNPRPRMFRLEEDRAIINRLGFNNEGHAAVLERLKKRNRRRGLVGVNIGANKDSEDRIADYTMGVRQFASVADYLTVNVSSPNTPGLRDLQEGDNLDALLQSVISAREAVRNISGKRAPVFLKIAPDLDEERLDAIAEIALRRAVDGIILTNTTLDRKGLSPSDAARETGGLSGRPLFQRSTVALARMRAAVGPEMTLIGVGGVSTAGDLLTKIRAGADLVQLYTAFIYGGPTLARDIVTDLSAILDREGVHTIAAYRSTQVEEWARRPLTA